MTGNNLFQLAQVVTELPMHYQPHRSEGHQPSSPLPANRPLAARKNACIVCAVCFTCSGYYGANCQCSETQPRRGKNLPEGGLDSRAKKLSPLDKEDYSFTIKWLDEFTHTIYRDRDHRIIGLKDLTEVSLCKAHSSTLYRAKKKHQRSQQQQQAPPSPADSNSTSMMEDVIRHRSSSVDSYPLLPQPHSNTYYPPPNASTSSNSNTSSHSSGSHKPNDTNFFGKSLNHPYCSGHENTIGGGPLAAKVRELSFQPLPCPRESPDLFMMASSTSNKRKRTSTLSRPSPSASTPLLYSNPISHQRRSPPLPPPPAPSSFLHLNSRPTHSFSSQLPPLHLRTPSLSSLSTNLQHQLHVSPSPFHHLDDTNNNDTNHNTDMHPHLPPPYTKIIETVSLKSSPSLKSLDPDLQNSDGDTYFIRNLAITDSYTFQDLLSEIDFAGSPPAGKRLVISDIKREKIFPLGQAIRSVIRYPRDTHIEFYLGLSDKASINWNNYK